MRTSIKKFVVCLANSSLLLLPRKVFARIERFILRQTVKPQLGLLGWANAVTAPISIKPKPNTAMVFTATAFLSKPPASPTGLGKIRGPTPTWSRLSRLHKRIAPGLLRRARFSRATPKFAHGSSPDRREKRRANHILIEHVQNKAQSPKRKAHREEQNALRMRLAFSLAVQLRR